MRRFAVLALAGVILFACDPNGPAPKNQDNACSILAQRSGWKRDLERAERKWQVPASVMMAIIWKESSFRQRARPRTGGGSSGGGRLRSSAYGFPQALDGTWEWYQKDTGQYRHRRDDFGHATDFVGWYVNESLKRSGIAKHDAYNNYLAYHQGHGGYNQGRYRNKAWLTQVARQVQVRADMYRAQWPYCR